MRLLKFETKGCGPCKMVQAYLEDKGVEVEQVDVLEDTDITEKYNVSSVPTLILVNDKGEELERSVGFNPEEMESFVNRMRG